jgi:hypothetical protein
MPKRKQNRRSTHPWGDHTTTMTEGREFLLPPQCLQQSQCQIGAGRAGHQRAPYSASAQPTRCAQLEGIAVAPGRRRGTRAPCDRAGAAAGLLRSRLPTPRRSRALPSRFRRRAGPQRGWKRAALQLGAQSRAHQRVVDIGRVGAPRPEGGFARSDLPPENPQTTVARRRRRHRTSTATARRDRAGDGDRAGARPAADAGMLPVPRAGDRSERGRRRPIPRRIPRRPCLPAPSDQSAHTKGLSPRRRAYQSAPGPPPRRGTARPGGAELPGRRQPPGLRKKSCTTRTPSLSDLPPENPQTTAARRRRHHRTGTATAASGSCRWRGSCRCSGRCRDAAGAGTGIVSRGP